MKPLTISICGLCRWKQISTFVNEIILRTERALDFLIFDTSEHCTEELKNCPAVEQENLSLEEVLDRSDILVYGGSTTDIRKQALEKNIPIIEPKGWTTSPLVKATLKAIEKV